MTPLVLVWILGGPVEVVPAVRVESPPGGVLTITAAMAFAGEQPIYVGEPLCNPANLRADSPMVCPGPGVRCPQCGGSCGACPTAHGYLPHVAACAAAGQRGNVMPSLRECVQP